VEGATRFNDIEVAEDGTISQPRPATRTATPWRLYKITPDGKSSILVKGAPLKQPNGVASPKGNVVVLNIGSKDVLTSRLPESCSRRKSRPTPATTGWRSCRRTKYVSSVRIGTVARIRPGQKRNSIASGIPSAAP